MKNNNNKLFLADTLIALERIQSNIATLAFVDPPIHSRYTTTFNNKNEQESLVEYSLYLSKVFQQLKRILTKDGLLFLYNIPSSPINFRLILDQIFERDFEDQTPYEISLKHTLISNSKNLVYDHDTLLVYSKSGEYNFNVVTRSLNVEELKMYNNIDERGRYAKKPLFTVSTIRDNKFEWMGFRPSEGRSWIYSKEKLEKLNNEGMIDFSNPTGKPTLKHYAKEKKVGTNWNDISTWVPHYERILNEKNHPIGQKPVLLMERIIKLGSKEGDLIIDPFMGFGTTLLAAEKNNRRWIGIDCLEGAVNATVTRLKKIKSKNTYDYYHENELNKLKKIYSNEYKEIIVHTKEIGTLQMDYKKLTENIYKLKELLRIEGSSPDEILEKVEDWIININKFIEKAPDEQVQIAEKDLYKYFDRYWSEDILEEDTKKFLKTSEVIYKNMDYNTFDSVLDFSPAVITLTKAIEFEFFTKIYNKVANYCSSEFGSSPEGLRQWPQTLVERYRGQLRQRTYTFGSIIYFLFRQWNNRNDQKSILEIVKEIKLFKEDAEIFDLSKRRILEEDFKIIHEHRNSIAHKDYISINTAEECRQIILHRKKLLLNILIMLDL